MKQLLPILLMVFYTVSLSQENTFGNWQGTMSPMQGMDIIFVMKIKKEKDNHFEFYCPSLGMKNIRTEKLKIKPDTIFFEIPELQGRFGGKFENDSTLSGYFFQGITKNPIEFIKKEKVLEINRPQEPIPPFPYKEQKVTFRNKKAGINLSGTLTLPEKSWEAPCVILITGSGPQNRDEELMGHKPFLVLSDYLTRHGIAVLRFDDRGFGESEGESYNATSADFAEDVEAAVSYLRNHKGINGSEIGLIGHSEGGIIAGIVAAKDPKIAFVVSLAGPSLSGDIILGQQSVLVLSKNGVDKDIISKTSKANNKIYSLIKKYDDNEKLTKKVEKEYRKLLKSIGPDNAERLGISESTVKVSVQQILSPWFKFFIRYNPENDYRKLKCRVLALNGSEDIQVPAKMNIENFKKIFNEIGSTDSRAEEIQGLNHLFQHCKTCEIMEYGLIEETISEEVMELISKWILKQ